MEFEDKSLAAARELSRQTDRERTELAKEVQAEVNKLIGVLMTAREL
jgi:hypothetical protein